MATRTVFDRAEIVLWRLAETEFRVEVWRSFSPWLAAALAEAARGATARPDSFFSRWISGKSDFRSLRLL